MSNKLIKKAQDGTNLQKEDSVRLLKIKPRYSGTNASDEHFFNYWKFQKDNSDVSEYFNNYLNSPGLERILNNQDKWWKSRHPYRKWYSNSDKGTRKWLEIAKDVEPNVYTADLYIDNSESIQIPGEEQRTVIVGRKQPVYPDPYEFSTNEVLGHEYAHGKTPFNLFGGAEFNKKSAQAEALSQNINTEPGHDSRQHEKHADIWGLKYLLYKEGIYDSRSDQDITIDQIQELRKRYPNMRVMQQMTDQQLMFQLNHVADSGITREVIPTARLGKKLIKKFQNPSGKLNYAQTIRAESDKAVPKWNRAVYSQFNSAWGYPSIPGAVVNGLVAGIRRIFGNSDKLQYKVVDKTGDNYSRYRFGLSVDPEYFGEVLDDGSVTLPKYNETEIPIDTTIIKNRIAADEEFIKNNQFTQKEWDIANGLLNTDKQTLDSLRHTYKTGEPVVINEFSYNSRPALKDFNYTEDNPTPLNMLQNYTIQYNPSDNTMYYSDVYDYNQFDWLVPGKAYKINGAINLNKKK